VTGPHHFGRDDTRGVVVERERVDGETEKDEMFPSSA
jgi:hypothetical protein